MEYPHFSGTRLETASAARTISKAPTTSWGNDEPSNYRAAAQSTTAARWSPDLSSSSSDQYSSSIATQFGVSRLLQAMNPFELVAKYASTGRYVPKAILILIGKKEHFARPDTGSDRNIISRAYAKQHGISFTRYKTENFRLGTGKTACATGIAASRISVPGLDFKRTVDFFVMEECPHPLIIGSKLIDELQLYTRNKHLLVSRLSFKSGLPILNRIGTRRQYIPFTADGFSLRATPDTGSDLDFISEDCAIRYGFEINSSDDLRRRILLGDNSTTDTIGEVQIQSVLLQSHDSFKHTFHVLRGLPCDAIFGEEILEAIDAFNTCEIIFGLEDLSNPQFNGLGDMGPSSWQSRYGKLRYGAGPAYTSQESDLAQHDRSINTEMYQRNKRDRETPRSDTEFWRMENARRAAFVQSHERCATCLSRPQDQRPSAWR